MPMAIDKLKVFNTSVRIFQLINAIVVFILGIYSWMHKGWWMGMGEAVIVMCSSPFPKHTLEPVEHRRFFNQYNLFFYHTFFAEI